MHEEQALVAWLEIANADRRALEEQLEHLRRDYRLQSLELSKVWRHLSVLAQRGNAYAAKVLREEVEE